MKLDDVTLIAISGHDRFVKANKKALSHCVGVCNFEQVKLFSPIKDGTFNTIEIPYLDVSLYAKFCVEELHKHIDTEYCLLVQSDGFIINTDYWTDEFLQYDYIGAPWPHHDHAVGNGGFCLRSKKFLQASSKLKYTSNAHLVAGLSERQFVQGHVAPEDWFIIIHNHEHMKKENIHYPSPELAFQFSVEHPSMIKQFDRYNLDTYKSFGFHGPFNVAAMEKLNES